MAMAGDVDDQDDLSVDGDVIVYRRIPDNPLYFEWDDALHRFILKPFGFQPSSHPPGGCSVILGDTLREQGLSPAQAIESIPGVFLAALRVADVRDTGFGIIRTPRASDPFHGEITKCKTRSEKKKLAALAVWVDGLAPIVREQ